MHGFNYLRCIHVSMYEYLLVYVSMCIYIYTYKPYLCICVIISASMVVFLHVPMHLYPSIDVFIIIYMSKFCLCMHLCTYLSYVFMYLSMYMCVCLCTSVCIYVCIYVMYLSVCRSIRLSACKPYLKYVSSIYISSCV